MTLLRATQTVLALYDGICFQAETKISIVGTSFETPANLRETRSRKSKQDRSFRLTWNLD